VEEIARTIERGVPGSTMPGYPHVSAEDRREIAIYIRSLQQQNADGE
jgi:mono/diheme cytochrome c family protein